MNTQEFIPDTLINAPENYPLDLSPEEVRKRFLEILSPFDHPAVPLNFKILSEENLHGIIRQKVSYDVDEGETVTAWHLYRADLTPEAPAVLAIHPHGGNEIFPLGKDSCSQPEPEKQINYAYHAALRGFRVLAPDALCFGERSPKFGYASNFMYETNVHMELCAKNRSLCWKSVWDNSRGIEVLEFLGAKKINVMGHSGGSTQSYILAAANPKVQAVVCFASFMTLRHQFYQFQAWHSLYHYIPGMMSAGIDWDQVFATIAPRPVFMVHGTADAGTPEVVVNTFRDAYRKVSPEGVVVFREEGQGHKFTMDALQAALDFLCEHSFQCVL